MTQLTDNQVMLIQKIIAANLSDEELSIIIAKAQEIKDNAG